MLSGTYRPRQLLMVISPSFNRGLEPRAPALAFGLAPSALPFPPCANYFSSSPLTFHCGLI